MMLINHKKQTKIKTMIKEELMREADTIHLKGVGKVSAIAYGDAKKGDVLIFNYGGRYEVVEDPKPKGKMVLVKLKNLDDGKVYDIKRKATTKIGFAKK